ncbi:FAD-dependent oxidoreductase [uncultured Thalassospira sp.]|jgi:predicted NAD/FAD-dependent oxidoreductase|uniref:NAD(P)/FAD-dependent oxidoreductase n=1 Tax=uncultured Thalassospira sp. TaxID=404382 RepID=UPI0030D8F392|tara:strand:+ start:12582 stop:13646 length:1065 start_codon:yes stop_codon:yes gene_type:complete
MPSQKVAIIGAGIAGLNAAHILHQAGFNVHIFEKSRGLGGRLATRRTEFGLFNHGAQFATSRYPDFIKYLEAATRQGSAEQWSPICWQPSITNQPQATISGSLGRQHPNHEPARWFRGFPAMNKLVSPLISDFSIHRSTRIACIEPRPNNRFELLGLPTTGEDDTPVSHGIFDGIIVAVPAPQSAEILMPLSARFDVINDVKMAPCWAVMIAFQNRINIDFDVIADAHLAVSWLARNSGAVDGPDTSGVFDRWTIHASPTWSQDHVDETADNVATQIKSHVWSIFADMNVTVPAIVMCQAHRWRFARTTQPLGQSHIAAFDGRVVAAGDWCMGARIEAAYQSGESAAHTIMAAL